MAAWRIVGALLFVAISGPSANAQSYALTETNRPGDCTRARIEMSLNGEMRVIRNGKPIPMKLQAKATHELQERILSMGAEGTPDKTARFYEHARAEIGVDRDRTLRTLRPHRQLCVAQRHKDRFQLYSPMGPLTREELELTSEHFEILAVPGLLPTKPVSIGDTWKVSNLVAQALCGFEGLTEQNLECKLTEVKEQQARVAISGNGSGIELGALVKVAIEGSYAFDLANKRLTRLDWNQKDERDQGPATPATVVQASTTLTRMAIEQPAALSDVALVSVPEGFEVPPYLLQLEYKDVKDRFGMIYAREWQTVSQSEEHAVLRLMESGEFVAQVTLTPWTKAEKGQHITPEEFRQAMSQTTGWQPRQELQAAEVPAEGGRWIYRISAAGLLDGSSVMQHFYAIAGPEGEQLIVVFTFDPKQAAKLNTRDLSMAASIEFPSTRKPGDNSK